MEAPLRFPEHEAFLRIVHSAPGGGDELYLGRALPGAIERYVKFWLPLVSHSIGSEGRGDAPLIPPVDIAWVWHLHRLAPRRYATYCTERFGRVLDPATAAFQAQTASDADDETRRLWRQRFGDEPFFQEVGDETIDTEWGARDPLSNQTTLCAEVKHKCAAVRTDLRFDYDVEACSARQRTFLWQVNRPACRDVNSATARYLRFLALMKRHGYHEHFFVPSYDIDFAWHTHMLASTTGYLRESAMLAGVSGGVDHDDSVNQRVEEGKLHEGWKGTNAMWALERDDGVGPMDKAGVEYRGEPPDWWFISDPSDVFRVRDDFLSPGEIDSALASLRREGNLRARSHSGFDMVCQVSPDVMYRLREQLEGTEVAVSDTGVIEKEANGSSTDYLSSTEVPARVCPASKSVPSHKDKPDGKSACVSSWTCVVYLTRHPGTALVLTDDVTGREFRVGVEPGRVCCWPNSRFTHRVDADSASDPTGFRYMLGPMAFNRTAGNGPCDDGLLYVEGGCGGGGCGGGACDGGGCGGGGTVGGAVGFGGDGKGGRGRSAIADSPPMVVTLRCCVIQ